MKALFHQKAFLQKSKNLHEKSAMLFLFLFLLSMAGYSQSTVNKSGLSVIYPTLYNANYLPIQERSAVLSFLDNDTPGIDYSNSTCKSSIGAGVLPGRGDFIIAPSAYNRIVYSGIWKLGPYRTDNGTGLGNPNAGSTRPLPAVKFSELFFIVAEAAVKGATTTAVSGDYGNDGTAYGLINIIRARAGRWNFSNAENAPYIADNSAAMTAATPATITIDYLLSERSREYFGDGRRWLDLVRTQEWGNLASSYQIASSTYGDHTPTTTTRDIQPYLYLRPIPIGQLNNMQMSTADLAAYQNPTYQ